jgi:hypothetical protein
MSMTDVETKDFDEWFSKYENSANANGIATREQAKEIWEASQNVIKLQMIKAFIPKLTPGCLG